MIKLPMQYTLSVFTMKNKFANKNMHTKLSSSWLAEKNGFSAFAYNI